MDTGPAALLNPVTIEVSLVSVLVRTLWNPASRIQAVQSALEKSKPPDERAPGPCGRDLSFRASRRSVRGTGSAPSETTCVLKARA